MILLIIIVVIIIVMSNRSKQATSDTSEENSAEIQKLNDELLKELAKPEPDLDKLKSLRAEIEKQKTQNATETSMASTTAQTNLSQSAIVSREEPKFAPRVTGLTVALYVGSLLVLAGAAGLVFSGAKVSGLVLLLIMTIIFYGGGIALRKNQTLKSASYVFVGTGMMMLPFLGLLIYDLAKGSAELIWLVMSLIGVPIYLFAAHIMKSKIFSYVALAGFVSLSCSMASVFGLALVWYFVFVMALGIIVEIVNLTPLGQKLGIMQETFRYAGAYLPAVTLLSSFVAAAVLTNLDYVIIFGVTALHAAMSYAFDKNIFKENLLRFIFPAWLILLINLIFPEVRIVGVAFAFAALAEILLVFFSLAKVKPTSDKNRQQTEIIWTIVSLAMFIFAGFLIGYKNAVWAWITGALAIDAIILFIIRYATKQNAWIIGLVAVGIALPPTFLNAFGVSGSTFLVVCTIAYLLEMVAFETLLWKNRDPRDDALTIAVISALGLAAVFSGQSQNLNPLTFAVISVCLFLRSRVLNNQQMKEASVYTAAMAIYSAISIALANTQLANTKAVINTNLAVLAHIALLSFITTSIFWEKGSKTRSRLIIGCAVLLFTVGGIAVSGSLWAMYLFITEAALILLAGVIIKNQILRIVGAVAVFLAVLWFTRDLSFVWPFVLGLGIIGVVVLILLKNSRKTPKMPTNPS